MSESTPSTGDTIQAKDATQLAQQVQQVNLYRTMAYPDNGRIPAVAAATIRTPQDVRLAVDTEREQQRREHIGQVGEGLGLSDEELDAVVPQEDVPVGPVETGYNAYVADLRRLRAAQRQEARRHPRAAEPVHEDIRPTPRERVLEQVMDPTAMSVRVINYINGSSRSSRNEDVFTEEEVAAVRRDPASLQQVLTDKLASHPEIVIDGFGPLSFLLQPEVIYNAIQRTAETNPHTFVHNFWVIRDYLPPEDAKELLLAAAHREHMSVVTFDAIRYGRFGDILSPDEQRSLILDLARTSTPFAFKMEYIRDFLDRGFLTTADLKEIALSYAATRDADARWAAAVYSLLGEDGKTVLHDSLVTALQGENAVAMLRDIEHLSDVLSETEIISALTFNLENNPGALESSPCITALARYLGNEKAAEFIRSGIEERRGEFFGHRELVRYILKSELLPVDERKAYFEIVMRETPYGVFEQTTFEDAMNLYNEHDRQGTVIRMVQTIPARIAISNIEHWAKYMHLADTELKPFVEQLIRRGDSYAFVVPFIGERRRETTMTRLFTDTEILGLVEYQRGKGQGDVATYYDSVIEILPEDQIKEFTARAVVGSSDTDDMLYHLNRINAERHMFTGEEVEGLITEASSTYDRVRSVMSSWEQWSGHVSPEFAYDYVQKWLQFAPDVVLYDFEKLIDSPIIPDDDAYVLAHRVTDLNPIDVLRHMDPVAGFIPGDEMDVADAAVAKLHSDPFAPASLLEMLITLRSMDTDTPEYQAALRDARFIYSSTSLIRMSDRAIEYLRLKQTTQNVIEQEDLATATKLLVVSDTFGGDSAAAVDMGSFSSVDELCRSVAQLVAKQINAGGESKRNIDSQLFWDYDQNSPFYTKYIEPLVENKQ